MSRWLLTAALTLMALTAPPAAASTQGSGPTPSQIRAAIASAEQSSNLWATVNICNTKRHPNTMGIRVQQPALGFSSTMSVRIQVQYWTGRAFRIDPAPQAMKLLQLGTAAQGLHQTGWNFPFAPGAGELRGTVRFQWALGRKVIGTTTRVTTGGHKHVIGADPPGHSAARCVIA